MLAAHLTVVLGLTLCTCPDHAVGACNEGQSCTTADGNIGKCLSGRCLSILPIDIRENLTFVITVKYPDKMLQKHGGSSLFVRGNGLGLEWIKGNQLQKTSSDTWQINIHYQSSLDGFQCQSCQDKSFLEHDQFQYRILLDDNQDMLGANFAVNLPLAKSSSYFNLKPEITVFPWFYSKSGTYENITLESPQIGGNRTISIYFPPSFHENTYKIYPVLIVTDLKAGYAQIKPYVFEELMYPHGATVEFVVIGFEDYKNCRTTLLTTPVGSEMYCKEGTYSNRCNNCYSSTTVDYTPAWFQVLKDKCGYRYFTGGKAEDTINFLLDTVYPRVQTISSNRLSTKRDDIGFMGYSNGGLTACHAAWTLPERVGFAACLSSSFWWPFNNVTWTTCDFNFINKTLKDPNYLKSRPPQKIYIDAGGAEANEPYMTKQVAIETAEYLDSMDYFTMNKNLWVHIFPGEHHSYYSWMKRAWRAMSVLLPAPGSPAMPQVSSLPIVG
ncbi:uncharacterized protein LOC123527158 [Mercenaria mercenaria]|uniref:uncharacterized protein LOC123527158 n=1 Tax=Mercenaria mercenaria TaxID=6596 RepID=UPI00234ECFD7|nr:uncharacterized protein LOC123527158 [Mercenaria mercenaria]XP_053379135.1 uncharacterized protein LOC123527158 [Mercenaria mercenaria]XP_053379136.1 uncharacterized protein LOC123527158 [Mercenaria mercenaria]